MKECLRKDVYQLPALWQFFDTIQQYPLSVFIAPMGYGKTFSLQSYLNARDCEYAFFHLPEPHESCDGLWSIVQRSALRSLPHLGTLLRDCPPPIAAGARSQAAGIIEDCISAPTYLVFDDYQNVKCPEFHKLIEVLARLQIPGLFIVLLSRTRPPFPWLDELRMKHLCHITGKLPFCFTIEDILQYAQMQGLSLSQPEAAKLFTYTEGWVGALHFVLPQVCAGGALGLDRPLQNLLQHALHESCTAQEIEWLLPLSKYEEFTLEEALHVSRGHDIATLIQRLSLDQSCITYHEKKNLYSWNSMIRAYLQTSRPPSAAPGAHAAENQLGTQPESSAMPYRLSERETQILRYLCQGMRRAQIADTLFISLSSVKKSIEIIYQKMRVNNVAAAVSLARELEITKDPFIRKQD